MLLSKRGVRALLATAAVLGLAGSAQAISISSVVISANAGNTANNKEDTLTAYAENLSTRSVLDTGGSSSDFIGATVDARTRYAAIVVADAGALTSRTRTATADYKITFTVTTNALTTYNLVINTSRLGATTTVEDSLSSNQAGASLGAVSGRLNGVVNTSLGLSAFGGSSGGSDNDVINQNGVLTITGLTGTQTITLDFSWTMTADSTCSGFGCNTAGVDEAAVRLGMTGTGSGSPGTTADDYPGVGSRTLANDGHFVNIAAVITATPEPGTVALLGLGLVGLAAARRRR